MTLTRTKDSLQEIIQNWKDQIICFSPKGEGYNAYLVDESNGNLVKYIHASCDELRHLATNYDLLLIKIKNKYDGCLKEAVLNTIKYETTRKAFKKQHEWIQDSYKNAIEQKQFTAEQQEIEIQQLKQIITEQKQEIASIKNECRGQLVAIQAEVLLKQKEAKIEQQNQEIAKLNQQLQECDRQINHLQTELNKGLHELKLKYKWLIAQFIQERLSRQKTDHNKKSLQACQNIFKKAQQKIQLPQYENKILKQENINFKTQPKILRI